MKELLDSAMVQLDDAQKSNLTPVEYNVNHYTLSCLRRAQLDCISVSNGCGIVSLFGIKVSVRSDLGNGIVLLVAQGGSDIA